ncbi:hypothetical protein ACN6LI_006014 [Streptomyces violaceoruber]
MGGDLLDVSSGLAVRDEAAGRCASGPRTRGGSTDGRADAVMLGRALLRDPYLALRRRASDRATWPAQYHRAL